MGLYSFDVLLEGIYALNNYYLLQDLQYCFNHNYTLQPYYLSTD